VMKRPLDCRPISRGCIGVLVTSAYTSVQKPRLQGLGVSTIHTEHKRLVLVPACPPCLDDIGDEGILAHDLAQLSLVVIASHIFDAGEIGMVGCKYLETTEITELD